LQADEKLDDKRRAVARRLQNSGPDPGTHVPHARPSSPPRRGENPRPSGEAPKDATATWRPLWIPRASIPKFDRESAFRATDVPRDALKTSRWERCPARSSTRADLRAPPVENCDAPSTTGDPGDQIETPTPQGRRAPHHLIDDGERQRFCTARRGPTEDSVKRTFSTRATETKTADGGLS
jgi:hypothetical protein